MQRFSFIKVRAGNKGTALKHLHYIFRLKYYAPRHGPFAENLSTRKYDDLVATGQGNLPYWASSVADFFAASDRHERKNGSAFRGVIFPLPRGLTSAAHIALVEEWCKREFGSRHAYVWAIHNPTGAFEGGEQPHVHIMFCERIIDRRMLSEERYFRRLNRKDPERGGYEKYGWQLTKDERRESLVLLRGRTAALINEFLISAQLLERVTHLSYKDRDIDVEPERRVSPSIRGKELEELLRQRKYRREVVRLHEESVATEHELERAHGDEIREHAAQWQERGTSSRVNAQPMKRDAGAADQATETHSSSKLEEAMQRLMADGFQEFLSLGTDRTIEDSKDKETDADVE